MYILSITLSIPKSIVEELRKKAEQAGISLEEYIVELALEGLDPVDKAIKYIEASQELLNQARKEFEKSNLRQASEKIWGAAALAIKAYALFKYNKRLTSHRELWEYEEKLAKEIGEWIDDAWRHASSMHINFYENWALKEHVERSLVKVEKLVSTVAKTISK